MNDRLPFRLSAWLNATRLSAREKQTEIVFYCYYLLLHFDSRGSNKLQKGAAAAAVAIVTSPPPLPSKPKDDSIEFASIQLERCGSAQ